METVTTKRPNYRHPKVIELAAAKVVLKVIEWLEEEGKVSEEDKVRVLDHVKKMLNSQGYDPDAYKLAKYLENSCYYDSDEGLVDALECVHFELLNAEKEVTKEWVKENNIVCSFKVGDNVKTKTYHNNQHIDVTGTVTRIDSETAKVTINCPFLGHRSPNLQGHSIPGTYGIIKNFEDIIEVNSR